MAISAESAQAPQQVQRTSQRATLRLLDLTLGALLLLLLLPPGVALSSLPWEVSMAVWVLPAACALGFALGAILAALPLSRRSTLAQFVAMPVLAIALVAGVALGLYGGEAAHLTGSNTLGAALLTGYAALLAALLPWLFKLNQAWLGIVIAWVTVGGVWRGDIGLRQVFWIIVLLALSLLTVGLRRLREETAIWLRDDLQRLGAVFWPSARAILTITLLVALVGLIPLAAQLGLLSQIWNRTPLGQKGPIPFDSPGGTPVASLGAPLGLGAPDISGTQPVLSYTLLAVPPLVPGASSVSGAPIFTQTPPLLGATYDQFNGQTWVQSPHLTPLTAATIGAHAPAQTLQARITLQSQPRSEGGAFLLGFDQPLGFSVQAQAQITDGDTLTALNVANWQSAAALGQGATYTTISTVVTPESVAQAQQSPQVAQATLDPAQAARLAAVPPADEAALHALAAGWIAGATTPEAQADAILTALRSYATLDATASPPANADGVQWFLQQKRGNVLLFTTAYILLGRSVGLPLRLAEGYLPGTYDASLHQWVVRASDAAVWAQLAIPAVGWLDYFPAGKTVTLTIPSTVIQVISKPKSPTGVKHTPPPSPFKRVTVTTQDTTLRSALLIGGALLALLVAVIGWLAWRWSRVGLGLDPLTRFFARVAALARLGGTTLRPSDTATQATAKVVARVPGETETLLALNTAYERMRYGPPLMRSTLTNLRAQWLKLRGPLTRLVITRPWRRR